jgi:hypothetical protein
VRSGAEAGWLRTFEAIQNQNLSTRRRGGVLTDLAMVGVLRRDPIHLVMYGDAALDTARQTRSGVIGRKLQSLQSHLSPFLGDSHVRYLDNQIKALTGAVAQ